ncbi:MAG: fluoride efflux transporter FluC [Lacisediminihabitans sp.]
MTQPPPHEPAPVWDDGLPLDSDIEADVTASGRARPVHLSWRNLALVAVGGVVGTSARELLTLAVPPLDGIPLTTLSINAIGALALGILLEALTRRGGDEGFRRTLRLLLGTGVLGGFTTYSALATDTAVLLQSRPAIAVLYAVGTVLLGAACTWAGIALGSVRHGQTHTRRRGGAS